MEAAVEFRDNDEVHGGGQTQPGRPGIRGGDCGIELAYRLGEKIRDTKIREEVTQKSSKKSSRVEKRIKTRSKDLFSE